MNAPTSSPEKFMLLSQKLNQQRARFDKWQQALSLAARELRDLLASSLGTPNDTYTAQDGLSSRRYVELMDLSGDEPMIHNGFFPARARTASGELVFGLAVAFPASGDAIYNVPVAARFRGGRAEFCLWDRESDGPFDSGWTQDRQIAVARIIEGLEQWFSYDPFEGPRQRSSIGFL
jgi:hypothetical protein